MQKISNVVLRGVLVALAYTLANMIIGGVLVALFGNVSMPIPSTNVLVLTTTVSGFLIGVTLGPLVTTLQISRHRAIWIVASILFLNMASVIIEGAFFAPGLLNAAFAVRIIVHQAILALTTGAAVCFLFSTGWKKKVRTRQQGIRLSIPRFILSCLNYLLFYYVFGAISYQLVTKNYYETLASLHVPDSKTVFFAEAIRSVLIVLSLVPLLRNWNSTKQRQAMVCGMLLFVIGGLVPLLLQVGTLPAGVLLASGVEIFFQNFLTGVVTALLLGRRQPSSAQERSQTVSGKAEQPVVM